MMSQKGEEMIQNNIPLKKAADPQITTNKSGVYILMLDGKIMKVGSAEIGIQKRMQQYYGLNQYCGLNNRININNRDRIQVSYQTCLKTQCRELESKLFRKYGSTNAMPWAVRSPHSEDDTCELKI